MATNADNKNIRSMWVGTTAEFSFAENAPAAFLAGGVAFPFRDFGSLTVVDFDNKIETTPRMVSTRTGNQQIGEVVTQKMTSFKLKSNEADPYKMQMAFSGTDAGAVTQAALSAVAGEALDFSVSPATTLWYQLRTTAGVQLHNITTVTIATLVENTDFIIDKIGGRIRFITPQTVSRTPIITCGVVPTIDGNIQWNSIVPLSKPLRKGYGRLMLFDTDPTNPLAMDWINFNCEITLEGTGFNTIDGKTAAEVMLKVNILDQPGVMNVRS
jgi:hypothetical protein